MSLLMCYLAVEKPLDDKPYTICETVTWFSIEVAIVLESNPKALEEGLKQLYAATHNCMDKTERGVTYEEIQALIPESNGGIYLITKDADLVKVPALATNT